MTSIEVAMWKQGRCAGTPRELSAATGDRETGRRQAARFHGFSQI